MGVKGRSGAGYPAAPAIAKETEAGSAIWAGGDAWLNRIPERGCGNWTVL